MTEHTNIYIRNWNTENRANYNSRFYIEYPEHWIALDLNTGQTSSTLFTGEDLKSESWYKELKLLDISLEDIHSILTEYCDE